MSATETIHQPRRASQEDIANADEQTSYSKNKTNFASSISPTRQKTRDQKILAENVFFQHCSSTYKAEFAYYNTMTEPAASALSHLRERETVFRNYVEKDRNLDFGFLADDFFDGREQIEMMEEEGIKRRHIEVDAMTQDHDDGERGVGHLSLSDVLGRGVKQAGIKTKLRLCQAEEHAERSKILWEMQKAMRRLGEEGNKEFLVHHHKETLRVNDNNKELFFGIPGATLNQQHHSQQKSASQLVKEVLEQEQEENNKKQEQQNNNNNVTTKSRSLPALKSASDNSTNNNKNNNSQTSGIGIISSSIVPNFPAVPEVDFTFLEESEVDIREVIERTGLQELRSAARALTAFQVDAMNDIEIMRLKKQESTARSTVIGFAFRYFLLMLQQKESALREFSLGISVVQHRTQIDVVENRCWLKAKENETWRNDRERSFTVAEERKSREQKWQRDRLDDEDRKNFVRSELQLRVDNSRDEHYARSIIQEQFDREFQVLRKREIASLVESEVSANTLRWTEEFHAQIVVSERQKRRQLVSEEASERNEVMSLEVRDYIQTRRDELFDEDTSDAMKHIDRVRERDGELTASTLPIKMSSTGVLAPRPPLASGGNYSLRSKIVNDESINNRQPVISYQRGTAGGSRPSSTPSGNNNNGTTTTATTGASLRAPKV